MISIPVKVCYAASKTLYRFLATNTPFARYDCVPVCTNQYSKGPFGSIEGPLELLRPQVTIRTQRHEGKCWINKVTGGVTISLLELLNIMIRT